VIDYPVCRLPTQLPYKVEFSIEAWEDRNGDRYDEPPLQRDLSNVYGVRVHVTNPDDPNEHHRFWAWVGGPFDTWDEWWLYVSTLMEMHGYSLA
jgi:hypothetical protein